MKGGREEGKKESRRKEKKDEVKDERDPLHISQFFKMDVFSPD